MRVIDLSMVDEIENGIGQASGNYCITSMLDIKCVKAICKFVG
jgi:hypothetical protein